MTPEALPRAAASPEVDPGRGARAALVAVLLLALAPLGCRPPGSTEQGSTEPGSTEQRSTEERSTDRGSATAAADAGDGAGGGDAARESEAPARRVEVASATRGTVRDTITLSTTLEARRTVEIPVQVTGTVARVLRRPGDRVEEGDPLLEIETRTFELAVREQQLAQSEATRRAATAELDHQNAQRSEEIALLAAEKAERELERIEGLLREIGRKAVSDEDVEAARFSRDEARLSHAIAVLATRRADGERVLADIVAQRAQVTLDRALLDLERAVVRAPMSGAVTFLEIRPGEQVAAGTPVATVVDPSELFCSVRVPQRRLAALRIGQEVEIEAETHLGRVFDGVLEAIVPVIDPEEGTIEARVRVDDARGDLRPGAYLSARIVLAERDDALLVPKRARLFEGNLSFLYVVREDRAVRLPVETGLLTDDEVEILPSSAALSSGGDHAGLDAGEPVITRGQSRLRGGERVIIAIADGVVVDPPTSSEDAAPGTGDVPAAANEEESAAPAGASPAEEDTAGSEAPDPSPRRG